MNFVYQAKVVGLNFHKVQNAVEEGNYVILVADTDNEFDKDAIAVYNAERELVGHIANSDRTLSVQNKANGNLSATELKGNLDFTNRQYYAEAVNVYRSCIYLEINDGKWSFINSSDDNSVEEEINEIEALKLEIDALKGLIADLQDQVTSLKTIVAIGGDENALPKTSDGKVLYSVVGLSHFDGQDHLGYDLSIVEEPIFEGAKGTALYLKSGDYRVGVFPSVKKKQYCLDHNIPYCDSKTLKGKIFDGNVSIEEIVYGEYAVVSV